MPVDKTPFSKSLPPVSHAARASQLSPRRREIIRPALEDPRRFALLSVRDMARELGTDPATTVRIARGLGFKSYKEFQYYLHELAIVRGTSLDTMQARPAPDSGVKSAMQTCLNHELRNFRTVYSGLDLDRLEKIARRLWRARRILLLGGDVVVSLISYLQYHLNTLGLPVFVATAPGEAAHLTRSLGKGDILIAITFRRGLRMTIEGIKQARNLGAYCIGITDTWISPVARFSDEFIVTPIDSDSFGVSYTAPLCMLNVLLVAVAEAHRGRTLQIMKKVAEEQRHGFRFYEE